MTSTEIGSTPEIKDSFGLNMLPIIKLHEHGDILLIIGEHDALQPVRISSAILRAASPVWNAMFSPLWKEGEASEVLLPDDNPEAMLLVLRIAHLNFRELPQKKALSFPSLLNLAIVCDKYDLVSIVRPFLDLHRWAEPYFYTNRSSTYHPEWLFLAWTFGYIESFESLATHLALNITVTPLCNDSDALIETETAQVVGQNMPPEILESILQVRKAVLSSMMQACYSALDEVLSSHTCHHNANKKNSVDSSKCYSMMLGSFISQLIARDLYPERKSGENLASSVRSMQRALERIHIDTFTSYDYDSIVKHGHTNSISRGRSLSPEPLVSAFFSDEYRSRKEKEKHQDRHGVTSHDVCGKNINLAACAQRAVAQMGSPTLESHRRHMKKQANE